MLRGVHFDALPFFVKRWNYIGLRLFEDIISVEDSYAQVRTFVPQKSANVCANH